MKFVIVTTVSSCEDPHEFQKLNLPILISFSSTFYFCHCSAAENPLYVCISAMEVPTETTKSASSVNIYVPLASQYFEISQQKHAESLTCSHITNNRCCHRTSILCRCQNPSWMFQGWVSKTQTLEDEGTVFL